MKVLDFNELKQDFPSDIWDIGWLTADDLIILANSPIKGEFKVFPVEENQIGIVFVKYSPRYDYSLGFETEDWFKRKDIFANTRELHLKKAAVLAGLGQQAKNTVFYSYRFGFDVHLAAYIIHDAEVINLPERKEPNFDFLPQCEGCDDCAKACPVHAIHNDNPRNIWVNFMDCMNFSHYGDHPVIPSIKYGWRNHFRPDVSIGELREIHNATEMSEKFGISDFESVFHLEDGGLQFVNYPTCRECVSQKKCSKYNGHHPYKWDVEIY